MNKKNCFRERKGGVTHKKLRASLGETKWEGQKEGERWLNRNDGSSWGGGGRGGQHRGERVKSSQSSGGEERKRQRPLSIRAREMEDGDVDR